MRRRNKLEMEAITESYEDIYAYLVNTVRKFKGRYPMAGALEDLMSEANELFVIAFDTYDPSRTTFEKWVSYRLWVGLLTNMGRRIRNHKRLASKQQPLPKDLPIPEAATHFNFHRLLLEDLSDDACYLVRLVFDPVPDMEIIYQGQEDPRPSLVRQALREFLTDLGWERERIQRVFLELLGVVNK